MVLQVVFVEVLRVLREYVAEDGTDGLLVAQLLELVAERDVLKHVYEELHMRPAEIQRDDKQGRKVEPL